MVDNAAHMEDAKLSYQRLHYSELRGALYSGLADALRVDDTGDVKRSPFFPSHMQRGTGLLGV